MDDKFDPAAFLENQAAFNSGRAIVYGLETLGFFAELNLLLATLAYCYANGIRFYLDDSRWNHRVQQGWTDYFQTLDQESLYIRNAPARVRARWAGARLVYHLSKFLPGPRSGDLPGLSIKSPRLTEEILRQRFSTIDRGGASVSFVELQREYADLIFNFSATVAGDVQRRMDELELRPGHYSSVHVRRGDKILEASRVETRNYLDCIEQYAPETKQLFVGSDDFGVVEEIRSLRPQWDVRSLVGPAKSGHDQAAFNRQSRQVIYEETLVLLTEVQIHTSAKLFAGSISSNVSRFIGLRRGDSGRTISMDAPSGSNFARYFRFWNPHTRTLDPAEN